jgi:uncharacterized membrane protein YuzA (DUF378 family)
MAQKSAIDWIASILVIIGALNWGLVGLAQFDLVAWLGGALGSWLATVLYVLVALSGIWILVKLFK